MFPIGDDNSSRRTYLHLGASEAIADADTGGVAYMAHIIGGFVAGFVLTFFLGGNRRAPALTG